MAHVSASLGALLLVLLVNHARAVEECTSLDFTRRANQALTGHTFKKLQLDVQQCMTECAKSVGCFSINTYQNGSGAQQCELLRSTAQSSPEDFVFRPGYEYRELTGCELPICLFDNKEARPDGSYRLMSSVYKLHPIRKTWTAAKDFCVSLGGNLASVNSETENKFLQQTMAFRMNFDPLSEFPWSSVLAYWKFDGNDTVGVKLRGSTSYKLLNGMTALYFDRSEYAQIPAVNIRTTSFTLISWVYYSYTGDFHMILADWTDSDGSFFWEISPSDYLRFAIANPSGTSILSGGDFGPLTRDQWNHVGITWNRDTLKAKFYVNGLLKGTSTASSGLNSIDLRNSGRTYFEVGVKDINTGACKLQGYLRDLAVLRKALTDEEMALSQASFDRTSGAWIGLNDVASEGTFVWSDNSAKTYTEWTPGEPNDQFSIQDCTVMRRDGKWEDNRCDKEMPFICEIAA